MTANTIYRNILRRAHQIAREVRGEYKSYAEGLRMGMLAAWAEKNAMTTVESRQRLSNSGFHRCGGNGSGKARWWLRGPSGFVTIPSVRGDSHFSVELDLPAGEYTLGVGIGRDAIRETFRVG